MSSFYVTKSDKFIWLNNNIELFDDEDEDKVDYLTPDFLTFVAWMYWLCPACVLYHMVGGGLARRDITVKQSESNWVTWDVHHTPHHQWLTQLSQPVRSRETTGTAWTGQDDTANSTLQTPLYTGLGPGTLWRSEYQSHIYQPPILGQWHSTLLDIRQWICDWMNIFTGEGDGYT